MHLADNKVRKYDSVLPNLGSYFALLELGWVMNKIDSLSSTINTLDPYVSCKNSAEFDSQTMETWLATNSRYVQAVPLNEVTSKNIFI